MASTSANSNHDVFISHRGEDTKKTLASHLYQCLLSHGIRAFLDQDEMEQGNDINDQIESAIRSASIHVAIFSVRYADSAWCLKELVLMQKSNSPIIPVFYKVKPDELKKKTTGTYAKKLEELKSRNDLIRVNEWKDALDIVPETSGFDLEAYNGDEGKLLRDLVEQIVKRVKPPASLLEVAKYPIGLDDKIEDFENTVLLQGKPQILGIVGLGGLGKTTLAKEFFNRKNSEYSKSCFFSNVKDNASDSCLISFQKKLLKSLNILDKKLERVNNVREGKDLLERSLSSVKVLVVIDDIDHEDQVDALFPNKTVLQSDSLILITSRNKDVLKRSRVEESSIYNLTGLGILHSLELFCLHSFKQPHPPREFKSLVYKYIEASSGFPLFLKVVGERLHGQNTGVWEDQLNKLKRLLPEDITKILKISYDALDKEEQSIFLDIACFFIGEDKDMAIRIWDGGLSGFKNIQAKCLVEVNSRNEIEMHDLLRDMGREIAEESGLPRRIWRWTENTSRDLWQHASNGEVNVRSIRMAASDYSDIGDIPMMVGLQLVKTEDVLLERILTKVQRPNLIWLRWNNCPLSSPTSSFSMEKLRVLHVHEHKLETLWENDQAPLQLRELKVQGSRAYNIPESIGKLKDLERIELGDRLFGSDLTKLPEEFCLLQSLQTLVLDRCKNMKSLPESFGKLTNLRHISLHGGDNLETLPSSFGELIKLQYLMLEGCKNLCLSSETLGNISTLQYLNLRYCEKIQVFPPQVVHQRSLKQLLFEGANINIKELPSAIGELSNLEELGIGGPLLDTLPSSLGNLKNLKKLAFVHCLVLKCLPASLGDLRNLGELMIHGCKELECLPAFIGQLSQLTHLWIRSCPLIRELPFLKEVKLEGESSSDLESSIDNRILPRLQRLEVSETNISEVSFAEGVCCNLFELKVSECDNMVEVGILPDRLLDLKVFDCRNLRKMDKINALAELEELDIRGSLELVELPHLEAMASLIELNASGCKKLKSIGGLGQLTNVQFLNISLCSELEELENIQNYVRLEILFANKCVKLKSIRGVGQLAKLRKVYVCECSELKELEGIQHCMSLKELHASGCKKLKSIRGLGQLVKLQKVFVSKCSELEELEGIQHCMSLKELHASGCKKLNSIRGLGQLAKLQEVYVSNCSELEDVEGIQHCMSLKLLSVFGCPKLQWTAGVVDQLRQRLTEKFYLQWTQEVSEQILENSGEDDDEYGYVLDYSQNSQNEKNYDEYEYDYMYYEDHDDHEDVMDTREDNDDDDEDHDDHEDVMDTREDNDDDDDYKDAMDPGHHGPLRKKSKLDP